VIGRVAQALRQPAAALDPAQRFDDLAGADRAPLLFRYVALAIGEALGFDAAPLYLQAALAQGDPLPHRLTLQALQAVARQAYQAGTDAPAPPASPGAVYRLDGVRVGPPTIAVGWQLLRCGHDQVAFWRRGAADDEHATAVVRITAMPPWTGSDAFVTYLRGVLLASVPRGYQVRTLQVQALAERPQPCAEATVVARGEQAPLRMRARFCYAGNAASHGSAVLYSHAGSDDVPQFEQEAADFLAQVTLAPG
jgi:hypothetical protein